MSEWIRDLCEMVRAFRHDRRGRCELVYRYKSGEIHSVEAKFIPEILELPMIVAQVVGPDETPQEARMIRFRKKWVSAFLSMSISSRVALYEEITDE